MLVCMSSLNQSVSYLNGGLAMNGKPLIAMHDISKVYHAGEVSVHALTKIEITIEKGEFVAIVGLLARQTPILGER